MVLSSDEPAFGGYSNVTKESDAVLKTDEGTYDNRPHSFQVRSGLPRRTSCQEPTAIACEGEELVLHSSASYQQAQRKLSIVSFGMASPASKHANGLKWGCTCYVRVLRMDVCQKAMVDVVLLFASQVYAPSRTVVVYAPAEYVDSHADQKPMGVPGLAVKGVGPYFGV